MDIVDILEEIGANGDISKNAKALSLALLALGSEPSDPELQEACGLSRAAVQKAIRELEGHGYFLRVKVRKVRRFCLPSETEPPYKNNNFITCTKPDLAHKQIVQETVPPGDSQENDDDDEPSSPETIQVLTQAGLDPQVAKRYGHLSKEVATQAVGYVKARATVNPGGYLCALLRNGCRWLKSLNTPNPATPAPKPQEAARSLPSYPRRKTWKKDRSEDCGGPTNLPRAEDDQTRKVQASIAFRVEEYKEQNRSRLSDLARQQLGELAVTGKEAERQFRLLLSGLVTDLARKELGLD